MVPWSDGLGLEPTSWQKSILRDQLKRLAEMLPFSDASVCSLVRLLRGPAKRCYENPNSDIGDLCIITSDSKLHMKKIKLHTVPASFQAKNTLNNAFPCQLFWESEWGREGVGRKKTRDRGSPQQQPSTLASRLHKPHCSINYRRFSLSVWIILAPEWIQGVLSDLVCSSRSLNLKIIAGALLAV